MIENTRHVFRSNREWAALANFTANVNTRNTLTHNTPNIFEVVKHLSSLGKSPAGKYFN